MLCLRANKTGLSWGQGPTIVGRCRHDAERWSFLRFDELQTERLVMRRWRDEDRAPFALMNRDAEVMRHFPQILSEEKSNTLFEKLKKHIEEHGYGPWAVERKDSGAFIGFTGLVHVPFDAHFTPAVEIGWRLASEHWGQGFATEAAMKSLELAFTSLNLSEVVSMTAPVNLASIRVMEKIGMWRDPKDDFDHPRLPPESPLRRHILYRISAPA